ncbi:unnamed protein product [Lupinus luteus]|uniref:TIR domain-containing protein n=1 Tax=Lupinus luteus TaxID=3873 RepID=A0AAV1XBP4_LUPLU
MALDEVSTKSKGKYHVFLSFRGEDTRLNFTDHLYEALVRKGIITFRDDEELERGESISQNLLDAIEESLIAIVVISKNYASSTWCLDELQKIVECKQSLGLHVFPIFYGVDPSHVRHQRESFEEAFNDHEHKFVGDKEKVQKWRDVLKYVAKLSGWDSKNKHESKLIEEIVEQVWKKLEPKLAINTDGLISIETKVNDLISHLRLELQDTHLIGIWGMGGIGKTTLADVVYNRIKSKFDFSCFLPNVREAYNEGDQGLVKLQDKLLSQYKPKSMVIDTARQGKDMIKNFLQNKKVLLVLDDVNAEIQLEHLAGNQNWFGGGSRIIVTTRDKHLLTSHGLLLAVYEMRLLNNQESLLLFCEKAFNGNQPLTEYLELSKKVVEYSGGLPLALKVYGSLFHGRPIQEWEDTLIKISRVPLDDILSMLKISYDMLEDEYKTIFLSIACLFNGWPKRTVKMILENCGMHPLTGINVLIEKSLIACDEICVLRMHDLLQEMGQKIVTQESPLDPGRHQWLWSFEDIDKVLRTNTGTEKVQGIVLNRRVQYDACWLPDAFSKMCNIILLFITCDLHLQIGIKCLSSSLKVVIWERYPLKALPLDVQLDELVYLGMFYSKIEKLWNGIHFFRKLKHINLVYCEDLIEIPDISGAPNLKQLCLNDCTKLVKVHYSVGLHKKLEVMIFCRCISLESFPSKMEMCSLKYLTLNYCSKLRRLPDFDDTMECFSELYLEYCTNLLSLPNTISNLKSLKILDICGCSKVDRLPNNINENKALEDLDISYTSIREMDSSLFHLENLKRLIFDGCSGPTFKSQGKLLTSLWKGWRKRYQIINTESLMLPRFISNLSSLTILALRDCNLKSLPEDIGHLPSLEKLDLCGNVDLSLHLASIANLSKLRILLFDGNMYGSRTLLPTHVRIYPQDSSADISVVNGPKLWNSFKSCCNEEEHIEDCSPFLLFPTSSMSINKNYPSYYIVGPVLSRHDNSSAYIETNCGMGIWFGVVLFIVLEPEVSLSMPLMTNSIYITWTFESLNEDVGTFHYNISTTANSNHYVMTIIMYDDIKYIQRHQSGYHHKNESNDFINFWENVENTQLKIEVTLEGRKIRKCWLQQLGKEDFRFESLTIPSTNL